LLASTIQKKLDILAKKIGYVGTFVAFSTFLALIIIKAVGGQAAARKSWGTWVIEAFIYGITIIVVAIPEVVICAVFIFAVIILDSTLLLFHVLAGSTIGSNYLTSVFHPQDAFGPKPNPPSGSVRNNGKCHRHLLRQDW
jgi:hypothetical protein